MPYADNYATNFIKTAFTFWLTLYIMSMTNAEKSLEYTQNVFGQTTRQSFSNFEPWKSWKYKQRWGLRPEPYCISDVSQKVICRSLVHKKCFGLIWQLVFIWEYLFFHGMLILHLRLKKLGGKFQKFWMIIIPGNCVRKP